MLHNSTVGGVRLIAVVTLMGCVTSNFRQRLGTFVSAVIGISPAAGITTPPSVPRAVLACASARPIQTQGLTTMWLSASRSARACRRLRLLVGLS